MEAARAVRAARAAEEAALSAVLDLRKCCDHPQLTSMWRRQGREGQLAQGIILSIGEQNQRRADELQNKLQVTSFCQHWTAPYNWTLSMQSHIQ